jgi:RNA polymerase sigma-54 factor
MERLRQFEPAGVFARDLADCLALQLDPAERGDRAMCTLLANLKLLAAGDRMRLAAVCGVDVPRLAAMIKRIRGLDPKPGLRFARDIPVWIVPDILVERDGDAPGGYRVRLNPATVPGCDLDIASYRRFAAAAKDRSEKATLQAQFDSARGLLTAVARRGATLLAIADAIIGHQRGFLDSGMTLLGPLTQRRIAADLDLDESTVSRAVADKTMATPRGLFGFDFFFDRGLPGGRPKAASAAQLRARLAALLAGEVEPLSDAALARLLAREGLVVARRTVAKYRESLNVPPAHQRRGQAGLRRRDGTPHPL